MRVIAITGGIGSGKTAVTDYLESKGYTVIDTDKMSHEMTAPGGKAIPYIREHFGDAFISDDGSLNRSKMRELVYNDPEKLRLLENGTTAVIVQDVRDIIRKQRTNGKGAVFIAVPLLFEKNADQNADPRSGEFADHAGMEYDAIWTVVADPEVRMQRVMNRDDISKEMVQKILDQQVDDAVRRERSTDIIENSAGPEELHRAVDRLLDKYELDQK